MEQPNETTDKQEPELAGEVKEEMLMLDPSPFKCNQDEQTINDYLAMRSRYEGQIAQIKAGSDAMVRRIQSKLAGLEYLLGAAVQQAAERLLKGQKKKSVLSVWGSVGFRKTPERLEVIDELAIPPGFRKTKEVIEIDKASLVKLFRETGEIPPGCQLKPSEDAFYAKSSHETSKTTIG